MPEGFLTVDDAAQLAGVSHWTVRVWIRKGFLTRYQSGARVLVRRDELLARVEPKKREAASNG